MDRRMQKRPAIAAAVMILLAGSVCCSPASAGEVIQVGGTGSALGTMRILGAAFEKNNPGVKVLVPPSIGSSGAIRAVSKGALDIGLVSRPLTEEERGLELSVIDYAKTPFVLVAWRGTAASGLDLENLARIYRGELLKWSNGERIRPVLRPANEIDTQLIRGM